MKSSMFALSCLSVNKTLVGKSSGMLKSVHFSSGAGDSLGISRGCLASLFFIEEIEKGDG